MDNSSVEKLPGGAIRTAVRRTGPTAAGPAAPGMPAVNDTRFEVAETDASRPAHTVPGSSIGSFGEEFSAAELDAAGRLLIRSRDLARQTVAAGESAAPSQDADAGTDMATASMHPGIAVYQRVQALIK